LSSVEEPTGDMHSSGNNSHEATQPEVIDINDDSADRSSSVLSATQNTSLSRKVRTWVVRSRMPGSKSSLLFSTFLNLPNN
jgi:hypothetical protein